MGDLTTNFSRYEFTCKCGCGFDDVKLRLIAKLQEARDIYDHPMIIKSGCRCPKWNKQEGGKSSSDHLTGEGADIICGSSHKRYILLPILAKFFTRIGIGSDYIHVGINLENPQEVLWLY